MEISEDFLAPGGQSALERPYTLFARIDLMIL